MLIRDLTADHVYLACGRTDMQDWLMPLVDCMHAELLKQPVIHADETPVQVLNEKGRKNKTKSYMWVYTNGEFVQEGRQIRIYEYHPGRNGGFAGKFLEGYAGILQTDGYASYEQISCKAHALCWGHARRYFVDAIPAGISPEETAESISGQAIRKINELFALDKELSHKSAEERQAERLRLEKDKLEAFIRNFTIGRKNWLFSASPKGAAASAAVYSIVETSKANDLEPFRYLTYLFEKLPNINFKIHPEVLEDFLPWSKEVQQKCK